MTENDQRLRNLFLVIAGALVIVALARFQPRTGGYVLLLIVLGMLLLYFSGRVSG